jgi:hypothetical protein
MYFDAGVATVASRELRNNTRAVLDRVDAVVSRALADTGLLITVESGRALADLPLPDEVAVSIITIGELRAGVLAATELSVRDRRLITLSTASALDPIPIDGMVAEA